MTFWIWVGECLLFPFLSRGINLFTTEALAKQDCTVLSSPPNAMAEGTSSVLLESPVWTTLKSEIEHVNLNEDP